MFKSTLVNGKRIWRRVRQVGLGLLCMAGTYRAAAQDEVRLSPASEMIMIYSLNDITVTNKGIVPLGVLTASFGPTVTIANRVDVGGCIAYTVMNWPNVHKMDGFYNACLSASVKTGVGRFGVTTGNLNITGRYNAFANGDDIPATQLGHAMWDLGDKHPFPACVLATYQGGHMRVFAGYAEYGAPGFKLAGTNPAPVFAAEYSNGKISIMLIGEYRSDKKCPDAQIYCKYTPNARTQIIANALNLGLRPGVMVSGRYGFDNGVSLIGVGMAQTGGIVGASLGVKLDSGLMLHMGGYARDSRPGCAKDFSPYVAIGYNGIFRAQNSLYQKNQSRGR